METKGRLVVGSRSRKEYVIINANKTGRLTPAKETGAEICQICGDEIKVNAEGKPFVGCNECGFPVCIACYNYERREGNQACPRCKTRYKLIKGCPGAEGDEEEEEEESDDSHSESEYGSKDPQHFSEAAYSSHHSTVNASRVTAPNPETHILKYDQEDAGVYSYKHALRIPPFMGHAKQAQPVPLTDSSTSVPARPMDPKKDKAVDGYGAAVWKQRTKEWKKRQNEKLQVVEHEGDGGDDPEFYGIDEGRQPLSMKLPISSSKMTPYRMTILLRLAVVLLFFDYRIRSPVPDAYGLWLTSVICEIWFALSWMFNQFPKVFPVERETYLDRLSLRYEKEGRPSELSDIDIFVTTVDPMKEPPLITANSILSILAVDYPVEKVACYFSDDGASLLTFEALSETCEFSRKWVPFCKKFNIEPRAPDCYFAQKVDYFQDKVLPAFVKERRAMKREYEEFKVRINGLVAMAQDVPKDGWKMQDGIPWHGNNVRDHRGMIQAFLGEDGDRDVEGNTLPRLFYVSREKRPGFDHHKKAGAMNALVRVSAVISNAPYILNVDCDHYINNSKALREAMCFMMDPISAKKICFVQFPQRFDSIDRHDRYPYPNAVFFNVNMKGLDGIQGPIYVGTGCVFRRQALYGWKTSESKWCCCGSRKKSYTEKSKENQKKTKSREASSLEIFAFETTEEGIEGIENEKLPSTMLEKKFGQSPDLISSTLLEEGGVSFAATFPSLLKEAIHVISCSFEYKTKWGKEIGWIYGSGILTGFKMHCDGWRSVYCIPKRPAFKGSIPINLSDHLRQVLGSALESVDIFLSKDCPIWYGYGRDLDPLERFSYINSVVYPLTSIPLITYCTLPAICLLTGKFIIPEFSDYAVMVFMTLFSSIVVTSILEMQWGGVTLDDWWRNEQCWVIDGVSSHLFALFQGILKFFTGVKTNITFPSRGGDDGEVSKLSLFKWTSLLILPTTLLIINIIGVVIGVLGAIINGYNDWGLLFGKLLFSLWVIVHIYPFLKGMMGKQAKVPTIILIWTIPLASIFLLLWLRVNPFVSKDGIVLEVCGLDCN